MTLSRRQFIGLVGAFGAAPLVWAEEQGKKISFAAINDMHVLDEKSTAIVKRAVGQINAMPDIDFTLVLGDMATDGKAAELQLVKKTLDGLKRPCFCLPGNHDFDPALNDGYQNYDREFAHRQWSEARAPWLFMGIDTCNGTSSNVTVPPERVAWMKKSLEGIDPKRPIALFSHHPFNPHTKAYRVKNAEEVLGLFSGYNLKLVASGHYHGNQIEERGGVLFTTTACCASTRGNFDKTDAKGFRVFRLDGETIKHEFVEVPA